MSNSWIIWGASYEVQTGIDPRAILRPRDENSLKLNLQRKPLQPAMFGKLKMREIKKQQLLKPFI